MKEITRKIGDEVTIKSLDWYNENKDKHGEVELDCEWWFVEGMSKYCGKTFIISEINKNKNYFLLENSFDEDYSWCDEMFEVAVFDEKISISCTTPSVIERFKIEMKNNWHSKLLINYIAESFDTDKLNCFLELKDFNCVNILKEFLILCAINDIQVTFYINEFQLLVAIYKFVVKNGYLPKFENIGV